jgi:branched-chain amino acid transport system substrate-binding protein
MFSRFVIALFCMLPAWSAGGGERPEIVATGLLPDSRHSGAIAIGLLVPSLSESDGFSRAVRRGAELAVRQANAAGGYRGQSFSLVVRSCEGPWGRTSGEVVKLVYDEEVIAVVAAVDGRNTHLAEQVATKTHVLLLSAWSGDPTLSRAYVPWFMHCVPDDVQQAEALLDAVFKPGGHKKVGLLVADTYDARTAAGQVEKAADKAAHPLITRTGFSSPEPDPDAVVRRVLAQKPDAVIVLGEPGEAVALMRMLRQKQPSIGLYSNLGLWKDPSWYAEGLKELEGTALISPEFWFSASGKNFSGEYERAHRTPVPVPAAYAYDAVNLIIRSVQAAGPDRDVLRSGFAARRHDDGVTGPFRFNSLGVRQVPVRLVRMEKGGPVLMK